MAESDLDYLIKHNGLIKVPKNSKDSKNEESSNNYRKVAKFLVLLGVDESAKILEHLDQEQIEKIVPEIASIRSVPDSEATVIFAEFKSLIAKQKTKGGVDTARSILEKAFGPVKAVKDEGAPVRSLVLSNVKPTIAAEVIKQMPKTDQKELLIRMAHMKSMDPDVVRRVNLSMHEKLLALDTAKSDQVDGRGALAEILKKMSVSDENAILNTLGSSDPDLERNLRDRLFTLDDVVQSDDKFLQKKLYSMEDSDIALLIAGKKDDFRAKILKNISKTRGDIVLEEEQLRKPMLKADVAKVTNKFIAELRVAWENGKLIVNTDDTVFV